MNTDSMDIWRQVMQEWSSYSPGLWGGVITLFVVYAIEIVLLKKRLIFSSGLREMEKAKREGTKITAKCVKCYCRERESDTKAPRRIYRATYEYEMDGKVRQKYVTSTSLRPPESIVLYRLPNSNKIVSEYDRSSNPAILLFYLFPIIAAGIVTNLMGGI